LLGVDKISYFIVIYIFGKYLGVMTMPLVDQKLASIVNFARDSKNTYVTEALSQEWNFRKKTTEELDHLFAGLKKIEPEEGIEVLQQKVSSKLEQDLDLTNYLNSTILKEYKPGHPEKHVTFPLKFNKMAIAIAGAQELTSTKFAKLLEGDLGDGYEYHTAVDDVTVLSENTDTIYGSSKGTFLKTAALTTLLVSDGKTHLYQANYLPLLGASSWVDASAIAHVTPLPESIDLRRCIEKDYSKYTYIFDDYAPSTSGFTFIHSGYAFGGHRDESRYPNGKLFGPEDCSSWVAKLCASKIQFSTVDQLFHYRNCLIRNNEENEGILTDSSWANSGTELEMTRLFDAAKIKDPQRDILPGQLYVHRNFNEDKIEDIYNSPGKAGHTGLVLGFNSDGKDSKIITMAYGRDMPKVEGFGIQEFPLTSSNKQVMFLKCKPKLS
jgi:hypothetical protein